jgi:hypothetical protein
MAHATDPVRGDARELRRGSLSLWEAVGISIALMAPALARRDAP